MEIYIAKNKTQMGPYDAVQISQMLDAGLLQKYELYWHEGMLDWEPVAGLKNKEKSSEQHIVPQQTPMPIQGHPGYASQPPVTNQNINQIGYPAARKSRAIFVVLGLFLGGLGIHNFYAGYSGKGAAQLLLTISSAVLAFVPLLVVAIWVLIELCTVTKDAQGVPFA